VRANVLQTASTDDVLTSGSIDPDRPAHIWELDGIVAGLRLSRDVTHNIRQGGIARRLPSPAALASILEKLTVVLFPTHYGQTDLVGEDVDAFVAANLESALSALAVEVQRALDFSLDGAAAARQRIARDVIQEFARDLPSIRARLASDLQAAYEGDPAATALPEILLGYPGMSAVIAYRLARALYLLGAPLVAKLISNIAHSRTAIDIHPGADIGARFFIDHGTGVVIGETAIIGERVRLYQAVTLGARNFPLDDNGAPVKGRPRHPIVEDNVVIYAGATILGRITIGRGSVIGGNVWLTQSVPPGSNISQAQTRRLKFTPGLTCFILAPVSRVQHLLRRALHRSGLARIAEAI
jgi:serine O-acetyltransferase